MLLFFLFCASAILGLLASRKLLGDFFSPPAIYNFFWCFALGVMQLDWVAFDPLRERVIGLIGGSYLCFMAGTMVVLLGPLAKPASFCAPSRWAMLDRVRFERGLLLLFAVGVAGFFIQLVHLQQSMGLVTFLRHPQLAREAYSNVKYLGFFNLLNVANFVLCVMYFCLYRKPKPIFFLMMAWALLSTLFTTDRTRFFYMVIWSFYSGTYCFPRLKVSPKLVGAVVGTISVLLIFFLLVAKFYKKEAYDDNAESVRVHRVMRPLVDPYIYLTGSFPVLQAFMEDSRELTYGRATFEPFVKVMELVDPHLERVELVGKFYRVPIELNVCTYIEPYFRDFGAVGAYLGALFTGIFSAWVYLYMRNRRQLFSAYFAGLVSFCTTISIFVNHYTQVATWFFILVGYLFFRGVVGQQSDPEQGFRAGIQVI